MIKSLNVINDTSKTIALNIRVSLSADKSCFILSESSFKRALKAGIKSGQKVTSGSFYKPYSGIIELRDNYAVVKK